MYHIAYQYKCVRVCGSQTRDAGSVKTKGAACLQVVYTVTLHGETLKTDFRVVNEDDKPFDFTAALHTYFEVAGIDKAKVNGLKVCSRPCGLSRPRRSPR